VALPRRRSLSRIIEHLPRHEIRNIALPKDTVNWNCSGPMSHVVPMMLEKLAATQVVSANVGAAKKHIAKH
jgi:hypothetical protein